MCLFQSNDRSLIQLKGPNWKIYPNEHTMQDEPLSGVGSTWSLHCRGCFWLLLPKQTSSLLSGWCISALEEQCHADEWFVLHLLMTLGAVM